MCGLQKDVDWRLGSCSLLVRLLCGQGQEPLKYCDVSRHWSLQVGTTAIQGAVPGVAGQVEVKKEGHSATLMP